MSLRLLGFGPKHWRNGTTFIGRATCGLIGEHRYDALRVYKRTMYAEWWYFKQTYLHWIFVNKSEWAAFMCILPKTDSSHGFPWKETQSRYGQFADDTINSDGYGGWYTYLWVGAATLWSVSDYFWPRRFFNSFDFLSEHNKERLAYVDGNASCSYDNSITFYWEIWQNMLAPHEFHRFREDRYVHFPPDSKLQSITISLNRQNTFYDHHWRGIGNETVMG